MPPTHLYRPPASAGRTGLGACLASLGPRRPVSCLAHGRCPRSTGSPSLPRGAPGHTCQHPAVVQDGSPFHTPLPVPRPRPRCPAPPVSSPTVKGKTLVLSFSFEQRWSRNKGGGHLNPRARLRPPPRPSCARRSRCRVAKGSSTGGQAPGGASKTPGVPADRGVFGIQETSDPTCAHAKGRPPERARGAEGGLQRGGLGTLQ